MPVVPASLLEPIWDQFAVLLPQRDPVTASHPLGCHRRRIADRVVFEHVVAALVHGTGYERIASQGCSDRTIRRRVREWAQAGIAQQLHTLTLAAFDKMIGLELADLAVDGSITKAPCGGERAGRSPVDRGKGGLKRSVLTDAGGLPLHVVSAPANRHDSPLLAPTLAGLGLLAPLPSQPTMHLDRGYDSTTTRDSLTEHGLRADIARKGVPAPVQAGKRWVVERCHSWMNSYGKLRRCTEKSAEIVDFYLFLAAALVITRQLIHRARRLYRWPSRPTTRRLR